MSRPRLEIKVERGVSMLNLWVGYDLKFSIHCWMQDGKCYGYAPVHVDGLGFRSVSVEQRETVKMLKDILGPIDFARPALQVAA